MNQTVDTRVLVEQLKIEWKRMWRERVDDHFRAEGIAIKDYSKLFVDRGTIIHATRDFRALSFKEILELHKIAPADRFLPPNPSVGGWGKFIRTAITCSSPRRGVRAAAYRAEQSARVKQHLKKGGRGWLHV